MLEIKPSQHTVRNVEVFEIWLHGTMIATMYPLPRQNGFRIISRHIKPPTMTITKGTDVIVLEVETK
jgi:hypothetical protein